MKKCIKCLMEKSLNKFYKDKPRLDGLSPYCKNCVRKYQSEIYAGSKDFRDKKRKNSRKRKLKRRQDYIENRDHINRKRREYRKSNIEKRKRYCRSVLQSRINAGIIVKKNICEICVRKAKTECHHPDYLKPYGFMELCRKCHRGIHRKYDQIIL